MQSSTVVFFHCLLPDTKKKIEHWVDEMDMLIRANIMLDLTLNLEAYHNFVTTLCFQGLPLKGNNIPDRLCFQTVLSFFFCFSKNSTTSLTCGSRTLCQHFYIETLAKISQNQKESYTLGPSRSCTESCSLSLQTVSYMDLMNLKFARAQTKAQKPKSHDLHGCTSMHTNKRSSACAIHLSRRSRARNKMKAEHGWIPGP